MKGSVFLDTNVLVYAHTDADPYKQIIAQDLIRANHTIISTQVLHELGNTLKKKFNCAWNDIAKVLAEASTNNRVFVNDEAIVMFACNLAQRYGFSFYDSLIVAAALVSGASILYSEDMQDGQQVEGSLTIKNPFSLLEKTSFA